MLIVGQFLCQKDISFYPRFNDINRRPGDHTGAFLFGRFKKIIYLHRTHPYGGKGVAFRAGAFQTPLPHKIQ